jgi:hypothetical protein
MYLGAAVLLNPGGGRIEAEGDDEVLSISYVLPYGGVSLGWSL